MSRIVHGLLGAAAIVLLVGSGAATAADDEAPAGTAASGQRTFDAVGCYQCHGYVGQGSRSSGPRLGPEPMLPWAAFSTQVRNPHGEMPPYGTKILPDQALADIYAYLRSLPQPPDARSLPLLN